MKTFIAQDTIYHLRHDTEDDHRRLVEMGSADVLLEFDSSLNIFTGSDERGGEMLGWLQAEDDKWMFHLCHERAGAFAYNTGQPVNDFDWRTMLEAEIFVCKWFIEQR